MCRLVPAGDTGAVTSLAVFPWKEKPVGIFRMASRTYCLVVGLENGSLWRAFFPNQSDTTGTAIFERYVSAYFSSTLLLFSLLQGL